METLQRTIDLDGRTVPYALRLSPRARYVRAEVGLRTGLRVTLPEGLPFAKAEAFLRARVRWVLRALDRMNRLARRIPDRTLEHGAKVPFLGADLTLDVSIGPARAERLGDSLIVHVPRRTPAAIRAALEPWYHAQAERFMNDACRGISDRHELYYGRIVIRSQRRRWGSCSARGTLSFNWRLMLAPEAVARYLAAHEMSHLAHPDHSRRFWAKVAEICPSWRDEEKWLKRNGVGLYL